MLISVRLCSICESRTHTTSTKGKCMKMHENQRFFRKSKSLTCPPSLPSTDHTNIGKNQAQTCSAVAMSRRSAELKAGNQRFSAESSGFHPKIHQSHRSRDVIWVRLSQIEQESAKISRTHALGSNTEMSARKLVKADEIEHRNNQNAQPGGN